MNLTKIGNLQLLFVQTLKTQKAVCILGGCKMQQEKQTSRTGEMVLGILGGVFGLIAAMMEIGVSGISSALGDNAGLGGLTFGMFVVSIASIVLPFFINKNRKLVGWLTVVAGIGMFIFAGYFGILCGILTLIGGILVLARK